MTNNYVVEKSASSEDNLREELPSDIQAVLERTIAEGEKLEAVVRTEMGPDGSRFEEGCIAVTDRRLLSLSRNGKGISVSTEIPRRDLSDLAIHESHAMARLVAHVGARGVPLAVFPRARTRVLRRLRFSCFPDLARQEGEQPPGQQSQEGEPHGPVAAPGVFPRHGSLPGAGWGGGEGSEPKICPTCRKPIPRRIGFCPDCIDRRKILVRMAALAKPYVLPMSLGLLLMLVITALEMAQPVLTKILVDTVIPQADMRLFGWVIAGIIAIHVLSSLFSGTRSYLMAWLGEKIVHDLRTSVYSHLQALSVEFYDQRQTGWIMDRVSADTANLQHFLAEGFQDLVRDVMTLIVILGVMLAMNWQLTLVTVIPAPLVVFLTWRFVRRIHSMFHALWRKRAYMTELLSNVIPGVRVVKAFGREQYESERFAERSRAFMDAAVRTSRTFSIFGPLTGFVTSLGFIMVWSWGGYLVITQKGVTLGTLIAFISYLWRFYGPLNNLSRFSQRIEHASTAAQRIFDVLDAEPTVKDPEDGKELPAGQADVVFRNVTFGYNPDEPVLKNMSFTARPGEMIGLVGPSGAGKSTTINLLCRFYDPDEGSIEIGGHDIRSVTLASLHRQIGVVLQEPFLFHGTIAENIAYGRPDATREQIIEAARAANAHDFIMRFPDGYDTLVGERGQHLSGGERQRIAIARAILKDPAILILDEATSSVDTETEAAIQQAIARLVKGRTTFAIAHRLSTLRDADRLLVLENGQIVESGTHEELLAKPDGVFRRLVDIQTKTSQIVAVGG